MGMGLEQLGLESMGMECSMEQLGLEQLELECWMELGVPKLWLLESIFYQQLFLEQSLLVWL